MHPQLTIFTPTYNRADHLPLLHASLKAQGVPKESFEWLVIDDGSEDDTREVLETLLIDDSVQMRYICKANGGKHSAINLAADQAQGEWILIIDSDDRLLPRVLIDVMEWLNASEKNEEIGLIRALRKFPEDYAVSGEFLVPENPCRHQGWLAAQKSFDSAEIVRKDVLQSCKFPLYPGECFMAESWLWLEISKKYKTFFVNRYTTYCEYQVDGLSATNDRLRAQSPLSAMAVYDQAYKTIHSRRVRSAVNWWRYYWHAKFKLSIQANIETFPLSILAPIGFILTMRDKLQYKSRRQR